MPDKLEIQYIPLSTLVNWDVNPKLHDLDSIELSILRYGFKDPPKFEPSLNDGEGGIVEGNGRAIVLARMKDNNVSAPRGIYVDDDEWYVPVVFGVDAPDRAEAESYGIDHNNLTLMGGGLNNTDLLQIWDEAALVGVLERIPNVGDIIVSIDKSNLDALLLGPSFDPTNEDDQPRLDKKKSSCCPNCDSKKVICQECGNEYEVG